MLLSFPWLLLAVIAYNAVVFTGTTLDAVVMQVAMMSGAGWELRLGDLVLTGALCLLFIEILKATRAGGHTLVDHALATIVFLICVIEFLVLPQAATSVFFFITLAALISLIAGFAVTARAARDDVAAAPGAG